MTKKEFIDRLTSLLACLPAQEREDALRYYEEYFDAAGPEAEQKTAAELGSPETVAQKILEGAGIEPKPKIQRGCVFWVLVAAAVVALALIVLMALNLAGNRPPRGVTVQQSAEVTAQADNGPPVELAADPDALTTITAEATGITKLDIDVDLGEVILRRDEVATAVTVVAEDVKPRFFTAVQKDNSYTIRYDCEDEVKNHRENAPTITITLPSAPLDELEVDVALGSVRLAEIESKTMDFELALGDLKADALTAETLDIENAMGKVTVDRLQVSRAAKIECAMGDLRVGLADTTENYHITAKCSMGSVRCGSDKTVNGTLERNPAAPRNLTLHCSMGNIEVNFLG